MKKGINFNINFTNRFIYTFVAFVFILIIGIGVFAFGTSDPSTFGHSADEFAPPVGCLVNQVLQWDGVNWICAGFSSGLWTAIGSNLYYNLGNIGIGTTTPQEKLDVIGNIKASGTICDGNGCVGSGGSGAGMEAFRTLGTFTFTVPAGVTSVIVEVWGGGGGGGLRDGGSGGYVKGDISVTPGEVISVTVGSEGSAGSQLTFLSGGNGGASSFKSIVAGGGVGSNWSGGGGTSGTATGGDINIVGGSKIQSVQGYPAGLGGRFGGPHTSDPLPIAGEPGLVIVTW